MTFRQIESMRQIRLFFTQVIVPIGIGVIAIDQMHPEWKHKISEKAKNTKQSIKRKINSKEFSVVKEDGE